MSGERTVMEVVRLSSGYLQSHGSTSPRLDAELLAATALRLRRLDLYLQFDRPLDEAQLAAVRELVRRRGGGEPVAYITGTREFYGRDFTVTPDVLVPRPETETLVDLALAAAPPRSAGLTIADLGTGSGCIAVSLAAELPSARLLATDISPEAIAVAAVNADRHEVGDRLVLREGDWAHPLAGEMADLVVANPPYIRRADLAALDRDVRDHEPSLALDGGADGLDAYRRLLPSIATILAPDGWAAVEIDIAAADAVLEIGRDALPGARARVHDDLSGRPRVVSFHRSSGA